IKAKIVHCHAHATSGARRQHFSATACATWYNIGAMAWASFSSSSGMECAARQACSNGQRSKPTSTRKRSYNSKSNP
ncbi:hypothetical protein HAX54_052714, partial [Datura stramonium]|nr:hypothetical protein [Datura stramonium]